MRRIWIKLNIFLLVSSFAILPAIGMAADFELFWDPNCSSDANLEGYYIYYSEDASVGDDPTGAIDVYVALTDIGFDPDDPSYLITDLIDDVRYCFVVTAWYGNEESGMSNQVCGINGTYTSDPGSGINPNPDSDPEINQTPEASPGLNSDAGNLSGGSGSGSGCFIGSMR